MSHSSWSPRRAVGLLAVPALAVSALAALPASSAQAAAPYDPNPVQHGSAWLSGELTDGLMFNPNFGGFNDYGLTVDTGLALAAVDDTAGVGSIATALAPKVTSYYTYDDYNADYTEVLGTHVSAGSLAKAAAFVEIAGEDPTSYGGQDLIDQLEARVSAEPASAGRINDVFFPAEQAEFNYANTIGQVFAAAALDDQGSTLTDPVTEYLLAQQCSEGYFRLDLGATTADTCDADPAAGPSTDVTALAVLQLQSQNDDTDVQTAIDSAVDWLTSTQGADGSFGSDGDITTPNANSTGLAGWALGVDGSTAAAEKAAVWLRTHQADDFGPCTSGLTAAEGAIAYDDAALATGRSDGIEDATSDQFRRATAQALPALQWAPVGTYASEPTSDSAFVRAGSQQRVAADGLAPGQTACFARGASQVLVNADSDGTATGKVRLPAGTGNRVYGVRLTDRLLGTITFRALDATKLGVDAKKSTIRQGGRQVVTVTGLKAGEKATVLFHGKQVGSGTAGRKGRVFASFRLSKSERAKPVRVVAKGRYGNRVGSDDFTVVAR